MTPIEVYEKDNKKLAKVAQEFDEDVNLSVLIDAAIKSEGPLAIINGKGKRVGVITRAELLRTVIEGTETS
jgi:glycine betaine/proline transport system ATP-binding protein